MKKNKYDLFLILKKLKMNKIRNNLSTLNNEKKRLEFIRQTLTEMLNGNCLGKSNEITGSELKGRATFSDNLIRKLEVSKNRERHVLKQITDNLSEINKIEKQKEKIIKKKEEFKIKKENLLELKKENIGRPRNFISTQMWHYYCNNLVKKIQWFQLITIIWVKNSK